MTHHHHTITTTITNNHHQQPPPPPENHHQYYPSTATTPAASIRCCCCLILLFSFLALLSLTVVLLIILALKPKKPQFALQQVQVQYITITTPTPTTAFMSLVIQMLFTATNDNKVNIKYGTSTFNIMNRGFPLGRGTVPGFYQPWHSVRRVQTTVTVDRVNMLQADAAILIRDATVNDRVELRIMGDVNVKIRI